MKYVKFTYVDAKTDICVNKTPARNGPKFPEIKGLAIFIFCGAQLSD
jgi:hypothetical protein